MGQYDPNQQYIGADGLPLTQDQINELLQQNQVDYGIEMDEYGQEMMGDQQHYQMQEQKPEKDPIQD